MHNINLIYDLTTQNKCLLFFFLKKRKLFIQIICSFPGGITNSNVHTHQIPTKSIAKNIPGFLFFSRNTVARIAIPVHLFPYKNLAPVPCTLYMADWVEREGLTQSHPVNFNGGGHLCLSCYNLTF